MLRPNRGQTVSINLDKRLSVCVDIIVFRSKQREKKKKNQNTLCSPIFMTSCSELPLFNTINLKLDIINFLLSENTINVIELQPVNYSLDVADILTLNITKWLLLFMKDCLGWHHSPLWIVDCTMICRTEQFNKRYKVVQLQTNQNQMLILWTEVP